MAECSACVRDRDRVRLGARVRVRVGLGVGLGFKGGEHLVRPAHCPLRRLVGRRAVRASGRRRDAVGAAARGDLGGRRLVEREVGVEEGGDEEERDAHLVQGWG